MASGPLPWTVRSTVAEGVVRAHADHHRIDDISVIRWHASPFEAVRGLRQIAATDHDYSVVDVIDSGRLEVRHSGLHSQVPAGGAISWDGRHAVRMRASEPTAGRRLAFPRKVLNEVGCHLSTMEPIGVPAATTVLRGYLDLLDAVLPNLSGPPAVAARNALLELIWGALQPDLPLDPQALLPARRAAVDRYLDTHLGDAGLSTEEVAAVHHISPRTLGRLFQDTNDTFSGVLAAKRLARVREELLIGEATVVSLARRWGFTDASHLSRRFRSAFGVSPTEYRAAARRSPAHLPGDSSGA